MWGWGELVGKGLHPVRNKAFEGVGGVRRWKEWRSTSTYRWQWQRERRGNIHFYPRRFAVLEWYVDACACVLVCIHCHNME